jgi:hypothetical protein
MTRRWLPPAVVLVTFVGIGLARIAATYPVFSQTWDEPAHIAAGMEWIDRGTYTYEPLHPPLARVFTALGPRLAGIRSAGHESVWLEGNSILHAGRRYDCNLALARAGVLPFFVLASMVVFFWARRICGWPAGAAAVALFTTLPPVLGHAGVATTDMAITATVVLAAYSAIRWLEEPTVPRGLVLGVSLAAALLSKFSALLFLPAGAAAIALVRWWARHSGVEEPSPKLGTRSIRAVYLAALLTVWAGYRFSVGPLVPPSNTNTTAPTSPGPLETLAHAHVFPAPGFFEGLGEVAAKNRAGHKSYLLGEVRDTGWWYFFPVALAVKTPLPFLLLVVAGIIAAVRMPLADDTTRRLIAPAIAAAILLVCLPSRINIGLRHVLPLYPFLAITAGTSAVAMARFRRAAPAGAVCAALLVGWQAAASVRSHPDYLAYFNELAGDQPERILVDSDLDDGQDLKRLADTLRARRVPSVWLAYAGSATVNEHGLPPIHWLQPHQRVKGWVAASLYSLKLGSLGLPGHDDFAWLESYEPVARVGTSIRLYYIP